MNKWTVCRPDPQVSEALAEAAGLEKICAEVLVSRGIDTYEKAADFFGGGELSDPFLIKDMRKAADALLAAADEGRRICVYGDYDCDGITASAVLYSYLECIGADVTYYINDRSEGYGICADAVRKLAADGVKLIVTVDNGISAHKEAALAKELGITLVITDHHRPAETLPEAEAVVDPHRADDLSPFKDLCGCGVALKLIAAMDGGNYEAALEQFSDLAAIATIADIVPLKGENREIVRTGLHYLENTENYGLKALMEAAGIKPPLTSSQTAFGIAPRINATGRMASAPEALELLLCTDPDEAEERASALNRLNAERRKTESDIMNEIREKLTADRNILNKRVLFIYGKGWHLGVIGIVASKLVERFGKPVFLLSDDGECARGSARSVAGFSVHKALTACSEVLTKFGGHEGAGGFSLSKENTEKFDSLLQKYAAENHPEMPRMTIHADKLLLPEELSVRNISSLSVLEPCGEGNPSPLFALPSVRILEVLPLSGGAHTKLKLTYGNKGVYGLMFGTRTDEFPYKAGDMLDLMAYPEINTYGGQTSVNLRITDLRKSGVPQNKYFAAKDAYERFKRGEGAEKALVPRIVPDRSDLVKVYRAVPAEGAQTDTIYFSVCSEDMNYCKFRLCLDIFEELGLVSADPYLETARLVPVREKADLESSALLAELRGLMQPAAV